MKKSMHGEYVLGIALDDGEQDEVRKSLPRGVQFAAASVEELASGGKGPVKTKPLSAFVHSSKWLNMTDTERRILGDTEIVSFVVLVDQGQMIQDLPAHTVFNHRFAGVLQRPLDAEQVEAVLEECRQTQDLFADIYHMTREISLERELLSRKIEQLDFLNRTILKIGRSLDAEKILSIVGREMRGFLAVHAMMLVVWENEGEETIRAELFVPSRLENDSFGPDTAGWLLARAEEAAARPVQSYRQNYVRGLPLRKEDSIFSRPEEIIGLRMDLGRNASGMLYVFSADAPHLGQDRMGTLQSLVGHLSLALTNSFTYRKVRSQAIFDGLTRIYNRRHFDIRFLEELKRHQRYGQHMGIMMLDLDHFKEVNDRYGHMAGDMVLREMGRILRMTLRESDVAARYGGEEFVVLLPQTREEQAWKLAQRIRQNIAKSHFSFEDREFKVTVSIGITSIKPGALDQTNNYLAEVDKALYLAKRNGRNTVCSSAMVREEECMPN